MSNAAMVYLQLVVDEDARRRYFANAAWTGHRHCDSCGRLHDDDGRPLTVARRERSRRYLCADCGAGA